MWNRNILTFFSPTSAHGSRQNLIPINEQVFVLIAARESFLSGWVEACRMSHRPARDEGSDVSWMYLCLLRGIHTNIAYCVLCIIEGPTLSVG